MIYLVSILLATSQLPGLGHPSWRTRETTERNLRAAGLAGYGAAYVGTWNPDPEIRARSHRIMDYGDDMVRLQNVAVGLVVILWPDDAEVKYWELPDFINEFVYKWAGEHPATFHKTWGAEAPGPWTTPVVYKLASIRSTIRPWRKWTW